MSVDHLPICDAGRCSAILDALARRDDRISSGMAAVIAEAIEATLADLGVDHTKADVRTAIGGHLTRLSGVAIPPPSGGRPQ